MARIDRIKSSSGRWYWLGLSYLVVTLQITKYYVDGRCEV